MLLNRAPTKNISIYFTLILVVLISTLIAWLPFLLRIDSFLGLKINNSSMQYIYRHYDGPLYIVPAKTLYNPKAFQELQVETQSPAIYFAAHLPLYPILIRLFAPLFGFLKSMIFVNLLFTSFLALFFYFLINKLNLSEKPLILTLVFLLFPRFLIVRSVGAPESIFILLILLSLYFFEKEKYFMAGIFGGLAVMTKTPGILLFIGYCLTLGEKWLEDKKINWKWSGILLIPLGLLLVFILYLIQFKDFFAYFHSGDNIHLVFPFSMFNANKTWVGTAWLEDVLFYFFVYFLAIFQLKDCKYRSFFYFGLVFAIATTFVQHRDIARYSLPLWSLTCIAYEKFLTSKKFLIIFMILLPAIYFYTWNFLQHNVMPIGNWAAFM